MAILLSSSSSSSAVTKFSFENEFRQQNSPTSSQLFAGFRRSKSVSSARTRIICSLKSQSKNRPNENFSKRIGSRVLSEGRDEDESYAPICPGCGVFMQDNDQNLPGFYQKREVSVASDSDSDLKDEGFDDEVFDDDNDVVIEANKIDEGVKWEAELVIGEEENLNLGLDLDLDGFAPAGVGYGNITEEYLASKKREKLSKTKKKIAARELAREEKARIGEATVCARCHSLRNYGAVKNNAAENLIPSFDFDRMISSRVVTKKNTSAAVVIVIVVDCVDFDGSFPRKAVESLYKSSKDDDPPRLVLVATKVDLLPSQISPTRLDRWVRQRARAAGARKLSGVYLVSSRKDLGVKNLLAFVKELAGPRGNVWVVGAQNAGKSTLINALAKKEGAKLTKLTEAPVPGTTLGILRVGGILPAKAKFYDTPGLLHPYLVSMRLNREEQKMAEIRKELRPRSYRMKVGQTVHVGGLMRLDLIKASVDTIYVTVWASPNVSLHMGKTENAEDTWKKHVGIRLQPPIGAERASEIGTLEARDIKVSGTSWDTNSMDVAVAGLGWFSMGLKGEATLRLWTLDGIEVTQREPLVLDRARIIERPGFWLPKAISDAIGDQSKLEARRKKFQEEEEEEKQESSQLLEV